MSDWTAGYTTDIDYTYGYYSELNPLRVQLAFLQARLAPPLISTACELGFGQGMSINLHAAASGITWHGTDFNPAQAAFAQEMAHSAQAGAHLFDDSFEEFCARSDLPAFDYIGLHGIWSWISDDNRRHIVDFVRRKLKVGGVLYISYNTQPGWAAMVPLRELFTEHASVMGAPGAGAVQRVDDALAFAEKLFATHPGYLRAHPGLADRLKKIKGQNRHYLVHEYFNRDWQPMSFSSMAQWLQPAKLQWACSAHLIDAVDGVNLTADQQALLSDIKDPVFRQTVRDHCVNQQFRKDYWVKGARTLTTSEQTEQLRSVLVVLTQPRPNVSLKIQGHLGEANMQAAIYEPILDALADRKPQTIGQLEQAVKGKKISFGQLVQAVVVLCGTGALAAAQDTPQVERARASASRLNSLLLDKSRSRPDMAYLASPVLGGGVSVGRFAQLFLLARQQGLGQPREWAEFAWNAISQQGERLRKNDQVLMSPSENIEELTQQAKAFADGQLPTLRALEVAE